MRADIWCALLVKWTNNVIISIAPRVLSTETNKNKKMHSECIFELKDIGDFWNKMLLYVHWQTHTGTGGNILLFAGWFQALFAFVPLYFLFHFPDCLHLNLICPLFTFVSYFLILAGLSGYSGSFWFLFLSCSYCVILVLLDFTSCFVP